MPENTGITRPRRDRADHTDTKNDAPRILGACIMAWGTMGGPSPCLADAGAMLHLAQSRHTRARCAQRLAKHRRIDVLEQLARSSPDHHPRPENRGKVRGR